MRPLLATRQTLAAQTVAGPVHSLGDYAWVQALATNTGKSAALGVGAILDFNMQIAGGENVQDALNKTILHSLVGVVISIAAGALIPATLTTSLALLVATGIFVVNYQLNQLMDNIYTNLF